MIQPADLQRLLDEGATLALIDVREQGEYNDAHIAWASSVPRRQLEQRMTRLVPFHGVRLVVCDDDGRRAGLAARTLERMGYSRVDVLDGGVNRWASEGLPTEWGMNVVSKDFGEKVEVQDHVPTIEARELAQRIERGDDLVILDARTPEEYRRWCIPGARNVPGGELALRISDVVSRPEAQIVVHCAGRTRSIIGARVLQRMGVPGVVSLKNGTSGWVLAGLELERGADRAELPDPSAESLARARAFARRVADEDGVELLSIQALQELIGRADQETVYLVDVRTDDEYAAGHIPGFWWFPGGQAVQRADDVAAVRNGRVVFCDDDGVRATVTASWFRQMGFPNVYAVDGGVRAWTSAELLRESGSAEDEPFGLAHARRSVHAISPTELQAALSGEASPLVLFVDTSQEFAAGHVAGARWLPRGWLELRAEGYAKDRDAPLVVTDRDGRNAFLAAATLQELGYQNVAALAGGTDAWRAVGLPLEQGLAGVMTPPDDVVVMGPERSYANMVEYLRWEEALGKKYER